MIRLLVAVLLSWPALAAADPFPALYDVSGVAADDVLNIRMEPSGETEIIGSLAANATDVEVVRLSDDQKWGLVNTGDLAGWTAMRYLARRPGQNWGVIPLDLYCSGTEPFWTFDMDDAGKARFGAPGAQDGFMINARVPGLASPGDLAVIAEGPAGRTTAIVSQASCNDGMSNREFGYTVGLLREAPASTVLHMGCCSLAR